MYWYGYYRDFVNFVLCKYYVIFINLRFIICLFLIILFRIGNDYYVIILECKYVEYFFNGYFLSFWVIDIFFFILNFDVKYK